MREIDLANAYIADYTACFEDNRNQEKIEFELETLLRQRIFGICLGYEDLNDHDELRKDPLFQRYAGRMIQQEMIANMTVTEGYH